MPDNSPTSKGKTIDDIVFEDLDHKAAKELFRKMNYQTSYNKQFGEPPKAAEDYVVMKQKKFRELEISKYC